MAFYRTWPRRELRGWVSSFSEKEQAFRVLVLSDPPLNENNKHRHRNGGVILGRLIVLFLAFFVLFFPLHSSAAFRVAPVRIFFDSTTKSVAITVQNEDEDKLTVQVDAMEWSQDEKGEDVYRPTKDIVFFPKMVTIEKGKERLIRVGYDGKAADVKEKTYRLFLEELPEQPKPGQTYVSMLIRMGIPIFINPAKETHGVNLQRTSMSRGALEVTVKNNGNSHVIVDKIKAVGTDAIGANVFTTEASGWYILAGNAIAYPVEVPAKDCPRLKEVKVWVNTDNTVLEGKVDVEAGMCAVP